jgi:hypothetical protein
MLTSTAYLIRVATEDDEPLLRRLASLDSTSPPGEPVLIGEIDGTPAAALGLADGRLVADPFIATGAIAVHLRLCAKSLLARQREPSLAARIRAAVLPSAAIRPQAA